jgi:hypothetical protein
MRWVVTNVVDGRDILLQFIAAVRVRSLIFGSITMILFSFDLMLVVAPHSLISFSMLATIVAQNLYSDYIILLSQKIFQGREL